MISESEMTKIMDPVSSSPWACDTFQRFRLWVFSIFSCSAHLTELSSGNLDELNTPDLVNHKTRERDRLKIFHAEKSLDNTWSMPQCTVFSTLTECLALAWQCFKLASRGRQRTSLTKGWYWASLIVILPYSFLDFWLPRYKSQLNLFSPFPSKTTTLLSEHLMYPSVCKTKLCLKAPERVAVATRAKFTVSTDYPLVTD